jgi:hypothetical protein
MSMSVPENKESGEFMQVCLSANPDLERNLEMRNAIYFSVSPGAIVRHALSECNIVAMLSIVRPSDAGVCIVKDVKYFRLAPPKAQDCSVETMETLFRASHKHMNASLAQGGSVCINGFEDDDWGSAVLLSYVMHRLGIDRESALDYLPSSKDNLVENTHLWRLLGSYEKKLLSSWTADNLPTLDMLPDLLSGTEDGIKSKMNTLESLPELSAWTIDELPPLQGIPCAVESNPDDGWDNCDSLIPVRA